MSIVKRIILGLLLLTLVPFSGVWGDLQPGKGNILWSDNFRPPNIEDYNGMSGWRLTETDAGQVQKRRVLISIEGGRARISNVSESSSTTLWRAIPLFPDRVIPGTLYQQIKVNRIGGSNIIWLFGNYITGDYPGIWTTPFRRVAAGEVLPAYMDYSLFIIGQDYLEVDYMRLVQGLPPMGAIWQRTGDPAWTEGINAGQEIFVLADLGKRKVPPRVRFFKVSYNRFGAFDLVKNDLQSLTMRDDGVEGDAKAGDGVWTLKVTRKDTGTCNVNELVAGITFGEGKADIAYAICPWPLP